MAQFSQMQVWAETGYGQEICQDSPSVPCGLCSRRMQALVNAADGERSSEAPGCYSPHTTTPHPEICGMFESHDVFTLALRRRNHWHRASVFAATTTPGSPRKHIMFSEECDLMLLRNTPIYNPYQDDWDFAGASLMVEYSHHCYPAWQAD